MLSNTDIEWLSSIRKYIFIFDYRPLFFGSLIKTVFKVLVLTVLATLVKYTTDENEVRILYEYLAEASVVFPKVS